MDKFSIPIIEELLDELHAAAFFSEIDLRLASEDAPCWYWENNIRTHEGHYKFLVMPFVLTNGPSTFQALMNSIFKSHLRKFILVFFDNILIYGSTYTQHLSHLGAVFEVLRKNTLFAKKSKFSFGKQEVEYLGLVITGQGIPPIPTRLKQSMTSQYTTQSSSWGVFWDLQGIIEDLRSIMASLASHLHSF